MGLRPMAPFCSNLRPMSPFIQNGTGGAVPGDFLSTLHGIPFSDMCRKKSLEPHLFHFLIKGPMG